MSKFLIHSLLAAAALLGAQFATAQQAAWNSSVEPLGGSNYRIVFEASIPSGYHMYDLGPYTDGPNATRIVVTPGPGAVLAGEIEALDEADRHYDPIYQTEIGTYERKARFAQRIRLEAPEATVRAAIEWMLCSDTSCLPPDDAEIEIVIPAAGAGTGAADKGAADKGAAAREQTAPAQAASTQTAPDSTVPDSTVPAPAAPQSDAEAEVAEPSRTAGGSLWSLIVEAILWGFAALLTPCVFPMVPMTVSFFMKGSDSPARGRLRASLYGTFIVALYTLPIAAIILITRLVGGDAVTADIFNWLATHWLPNIIFFLVFMIFAASFFGAFEITMPSWMVNKSDSKADTKGVGGIFFMALTLVLVSFSCTGPIVGSVLIKSTSGEFWDPIVTMFAFSVAFALPFTLFAFFPSMLKKLPRSGGWLNSVKVVLGFIEVALGFKFLSVADQTYHWGLLDREIYLAIWIVTFSLLGLYLLGKIRFAHDEQADRPLGVGRLALSIVVFSFVVYLIPGMWGAPLKGLSGYLPPLATQDFVLGGTASAPQTPEPSLRKVKYGDFLRLPHGLEGFFDLDEAEAYAARVGKPLFVDFTGHGCVNCREMESRVWSDPEVLSILRNDYVICALYSDDKKELPESDWVTTDTGKVLKSLGKINAYLARTRYGANAQPCYILQGRDGELLAPSRGYDLSVEGFVAFLRSGLEAYGK